MNTLRITKCLTCFLFALLVGCSGGEGGTGLVSSDYDIAVGKLESKQANSMIVNGVNFKTSDATVLIDGTAGDMSVLDQGMVVAVTGTIDDNGVDGVAQGISTKSIIKGVVQDNNKTDKLTVMGQMVLVPADTVLVQQGAGAITIETIQPGASVEISGYIRSSGTLSATRVEVKVSAFAEQKVVGLISKLETGTFQIGDMTVTYPTSITEPALREGMWVEVKGSFDAAKNTMTAIEIERFANGSDSTNAPKMRLEGFVTQLTSAMEFMLNNIHVVVDVNTEFRGGASADILLGAELDVEGELVDSVLYAHKIEFEDAIRIEATVASTDPASGTITLAGFSGPGMVYTLKTQSFTEFNSPALDALTDATIRIRGRLVEETTTVFVNRIDDRSPSQDVFLQGPVNRVGNDEVEILGEVINTSSFDSTGDFKKDNRSIGRDAFYAAVESGSIVKAKGSVPAVAGGGIVWTAVEIE